MVEGDLGPSNRPYSPIETATQDLLPFKPTVCNGVSIRRDPKSFLLKSGLPDLGRLGQLPTRDEEVDVPDRLAAVGLKAERGQLLPGLFGRFGILCPIEVGQVLFQRGGILWDQSFKDEVRVIEGFSPDFVYESALVRVVGQDVGKVGEGPFKFALLQKEVSGNPSSPIRGGEDHDGIFQDAFGGTSFSHPLKDLCKMEPVLLLQGVFLSSLLEILGRLFQVDLEEIPLMDDP